MKKKKENWCTLLVPRRLWMCTSARSGRGASFFFFGGEGALTDLYHTHTQPQPRRLALTLSSQGAFFKKQNEKNRRDSCECTICSLFFPPFSKRIRSLFTVQARTGAGVPSFRAFTPGRRGSSLPYFRHLRPRKHRPSAPSIYRRRPVIANAHTAPPPPRVLGVCAYVCATCKYIKKRE